jgi:hypothetical protein
MAAAAASSGRHHHPRTRRPLLSRASRHRATGVCSNQFHRTARAPTAPVTLPFVGATIERSNSFLLGEISSSVASQVAFIEKVKALAPQYRTELLREA